MCTCLPDVDRAAVTMRMRNWVDSLANGLERAIVPLFASLDPDENVSAVVYEEACILLAVVAEGLEDPPPWNAVHPSLRPRELAVFWICRYMYHTLSSVSTTHPHPAPRTLKPLTDLVWELLYRGFL